MAIKTFTTGEVLTAADTNTYLANSGLVYVASKTFTNAATSTSDVGAFSSTYQDYVLTITAVNSSTSPQDIYFNFMSGASFINGPDYFFGLIYITSAGGPTRGYQPGQTNTRMMYADDGTGTSELTITKPNQAKKSSLFSTFTSWGSGANLLGTGYGLHNLATAYDGFRLTFTGTNATGSWTLYGKRSA